LGLVSKRSNISKNHLIACRIDDGSVSTKNLVEFLPPLSEISGGV